MAQPPAGSSLLFGALADSGRLKERKNGRYLMVLKGVDEIDWFTDRPDRAAGVWSPKKLVKKWDVMFSDGDGAPNAQATFEIGGKRKLVTFEIWKPKLGDSNQTLSFKVRGIGDKNKDMLIDLKNNQLSNASLFIDDAVNMAACYPACEEASFANKDLTNANLTNANLANANLYGAYMFNTILYGAYMFNANLSDAYMINTNLENANLNGADLTDADLTDADLTDANLRGADLTDANLTGANLTDVIWGTTIPPYGPANDGSFPFIEEPYFS